MAGLFGGSAGKSDMKKSNQLMQDNIAKLEAIEIPTIEAQQIALTNPEMVDNLVADYQQKSSLEDIELDPRLRMSALKSLSGVEELAQQGFGAEDIAAFRESGRRAAGQAQAQLASQEQRMSEQGMSDSGLSAILRQAAGQQAADRVSQEGINIAAQAAAARRQALGQQSDMASRMSRELLDASQIRGSAQERRLSQGAQAANMIKQFNQQNTIDRNKIVAANASQQEIYNKNLPQQQFQNQMAKTGGVVGAQGQQASNLQAQAAAAQQAQQAQTGALIGLAGTVAGAAIGGPPGAVAGKTFADSASKITAQPNAPIVGGNYEDPMTKYRA